MKYLWERWGEMSSKNCRGERVRGHLPVREAERLEKQGGERAGQRFCPMERIGTAALENPTGFQFKKSFSFLLRPEFAALLPMKSAISWGPQNCAGGAKSRRCSVNSGNPSAFCSGWDGAVCAGPWPRSAGCALG